MTDEAQLNSEPLSVTRWRSALASARSPAIFLLVSAVLMAVAWALVNWQITNQIRWMVIFTVGALIIFHVTAWSIAGLSDDRTYKLVDYLFLGFGFAALLSVIDTQSDVAKEDFSRAGHYYSTWRDERCREPESRRCRFYEQQQQLMDEVSRDPSALSRMMFLTFDQRMELRDQSVGPDTQERKVLEDDFKIFDSHMSRLNRFRELIVGYKSAFDRFLVIYLAALAIAIRITKVTAELFKWYRTKPALPAP